MMSLNGKCNRLGLEIAGVFSSRRPMVDAVNRGIAQSLLKTLRILAKIMQQSRQLGLGFHPQGTREISGEVGNFLQMLS